MRLIFGCIFLLFTSCLDGQRVILINSIPENTPDGDLIHFAGEPNNWNPGDEEWVFSESELGWELILPEETADTFQGKITRGSWETVEGNATGGFLPNRSFDFSQSDTVEISVLSWEGEFQPDDLPDNLVTYNDEFYMTELERTRRIRVLLPLDYDDTNIHYPVLYMHDGQNLFSDQESFAGEWEIDEALAAFDADGFEGAIIVAIDNGGGLRIDEYTPYSHPVYGGGEGDLYVDFIVNTLKPAIDEEYRTLTSRESNGLMGSSLGGLISFYGGIKYQDVFSKVGVFSPSFWFNDSIYDYVEEIGKTADMQFYFLAGGQESETLDQQVLDMIATMEAEGFQENEINYEFVPSGQHSEWFWAQEFPDAFEWLYINSSLSINDPIGNGIVEIYPNPSSDLVFLNSDLEIMSWSIFDLSGKLLLSGNTYNNSIDISELPAGLFLVSITTESETAVRKIIKE